MDGQTDERSDTHKVKNGRKDRKIKIHVIRVGEGGREKGKEGVCEKTQREREKKREREGGGGGR